VFTLTKEAIEFRDNSQTSSIKWIDINDLKISKDSAGYKSSMMIVTNNFTKTIDITGLNKTPEDLKILMEIFSKDLKK